MCDCKSYNGEIGTIEEVICTPPSHLIDGKDSVCIDACIVDIMRKLWDNNIATHGCCCGHNKEFPCVIVANKEDVKRTAYLLHAIDKRRSWVVKYWDLVDYKG